MYERALLYKDMYNYCQSLGCGPKQDEPRPFFALPQSLIPCQLVKETSVDTGGGASHYYYRVVLRRRRGKKDMKGQDVPGSSTGGKKGEGGSSRSKGRQVIKRREMIG